MPDPKFKFEMGSELRCQVTGFTGIVLGRIEYFNGCLQYGLKPPMGDDKKMLDAIYIDEERLEDTGTSGAKKLARKVSGSPIPGGPQESPMERQGP